MTCFSDCPLDINPAEPDACFHASSFAKNALRLLEHETAGVFFGFVIELAREHGWVSIEPFSVDGTVIEA